MKAKALLQQGTNARGQGDLAGAERCFREAVKSDPTHSPAYHNLGLALCELARFHEAEQACREGLKNDPSYRPLYLSLGYALKGQGKLREAEEMFRKILALEPDNDRLYANIGSIVAEQGRRDDAAELFERAVALRPENTDAHRMLALCKKFKAGDPQIIAMEDVLEQGTLDNNGIVNMRFALGKAYDDLKNYETAFQHYEQGNKLLRQSWPYKTDDTRQFFEQIQTAFTSDFIEKHKESGVDTVQPIFILGMPRSGTSLTEQILASHPDVTGAGELGYLARAQDTECGTTMHGYADAMGAATPAQIAKTAQNYLAMLQMHDTGRKHITDKMPHNFQYVGLIHVLFPRAKIIHCRRDPVATCLSAYKIRFSGHLPFAYDLKELGEYYRLYEAHMAYWRELLPGVMHDVRYEELVADPELVIRALLEYCDLPWSEACLAFHETERPGLTASTLDIRRPLYQDAIDKWRHYEPYIGPLLAALNKANS